jgi:hypothetical protein
MLIELPNISQTLVDELNDIYFPNGMALIPDDKKKELIDHIDQKFRELEEELKKGR